MCALFFFFVCVCVHLCAHFCLSLCLGVRLCVSLSFFVLFTFSLCTHKIHHVLIDTDAWVYPEVFHLAKPQIAWLAEDLAAVNRTETPWLFVYG